MDGYISSSFVFDKTNTRFTILNLYDEDEDYYNCKIIPPLSSTPQVINPIKLEEAFIPPSYNKCYCIIS